jgi:Ca2+-binding RTX toxin-like protein
VKKILILAALGAAALVPGANSAASPSQTFSLLLKGGDAPNVITIDFAPGDRTKFLITANGALTPVETCINPPGEADQLQCPVADISGFTVRTNGGSDTVTVGKMVPVSTILNGGSGLDDLIGSANTDRLVGGAGDDKLVGRMGADQLFGGEGEDLLIGGAGKDVLRGGPGLDVLHGGPGRDDLLQ